MNDHNQKTTTTMTTGPAADVAAVTAVMASCFNLPFLVGNHLNRVPAMIFSLDRGRNA
jgi:hypothetical protein